MNALRRRPVEPGNTGIDDLAQWITDVAARNAVRLELRQKASTDESRVREWEIFGDSRPPRELARDIWLYAERDGRHLRGPVLYALLAYRADDAVYFDRTFVKSSGREPTDEVLDAEPPNREGVTSQLMRHNEANMRLAVGQTLEVIRSYQRQLDAKEERIRELEQREVQVLQLYEQLTTRKHERELELMKQKQVEKGREFVKQQLMHFGPIIARKLTTGNAGAQAIFGEETLRNIFKGLRQDQLNSIVECLDPHQATALVELYLSYVERDAKKDGGRAREEEASAGEETAADGVSS